MEGGGGDMEKKQKSIRETMEHREFVSRSMLWCTNEMERVHLPKNQNIHNNISIKSTKTSSSTSTAAAATTTPTAIVSQPKTIRQFVNKMGIYKYEFLVSTHLSLESRKQLSFDSLTQ